MRLIAPCIALTMAWAGHAFAKSPIFPTCAEERLDPAAYAICMADAEQRRVPLPSATQADGLRTAPHAAVVTDDAKAPDSHARRSVRAARGRR